MTDQKTEVAKQDAPPADNLPGQGGKQAFGIGEMWSSLVELVRDKDVDAGKLQVLAGVQKSMVDSESQRRFEMARQKVQRALPVIRKNKMIVHPGKNGAPDRVVGRYRDFDSLMALCQPVLRPEGFEVTFLPGVDEGTKFPTCTCVVSWTDGELHWSQSYGPMPIPIDSTGSKSGPQGAASALTYGKRHTFCAAFNVTFEGDDDDASKDVLVPKLSQSEEAILTAARDAAAQGSDAYQRWFQGNSQMTRGWLIDAGHHASFKSDAAEVDG